MADAAVVMVEKSSVSSSRDGPRNPATRPTKTAREVLSVRFTFATSGHQIRSVDMAAGVESDVAGIPTPDELWEATFAQANVWRDRFASVPF